METTLETNILIAKYLGFDITHKVNSIPDDCPKFIHECLNLKANNASNLPFHEDWNWLVFAISTIVSSNDYTNYLDILLDPFSDGIDINASSIDSTYCNVVSYIKWFYNHKKENTKLITEKHDAIRSILIEYGCKEFGDVIIDAICGVFNYPRTIDIEGE